MKRSKLNLTSLFSKPINNNGEERDVDATPTSSSHSSSWAWPSCKQPRTDSFRSAAGPGPNSNVFKTINFAYFDSSDDDYESEAIIGSLARSSRLVFEPRGKTSSILEQDNKCKDKFRKTPPSFSGFAKNPQDCGNCEKSSPFKESVAMAMESEDPYGDFRRSMEEMVVVHGVREWDQLEELLVWYLRVNGKRNHGFIVGAFVDLMLSLALPAESETSCCSNSMFSTSFGLEEGEGSS